MKQTKKIFYLIAILNFYHNIKKRETDCLEYLELLAEEKVNLDINLAQKAVLQYCLNLDTAEDTWKELMALTHNIKYKLPLINSRYDELEHDDWRDHAVNHVTNMMK